MKTYKLLKIYKKFIKTLKRLKSINFYKRLISNLNIT